MVSEDVIDMGVGSLDEEHAFLNAARNVAIRKFAEERGKLSSYPKRYGVPELREAISNLLHLPEGNDMIITAGATRALDHIFDALCSEYRFLVQTPAYYRTLHKLDDMPKRKYKTWNQVNELNRLRSSSQKNAVYLTSNFGTFNGRSLSLPEQNEVVDFVQSKGGLIIDDAPCQELWFSESAPACLMNEQDADVLYVGSLSKLIGPGSDVGFLSGPEKILDYIKKQLGGRTIGGSHDSQLIAKHMLATDKLLESVREIFRNQWESFKTQLEENDLHDFEDVQGGMFTTLSLPDESEEIAIVSQCRERGVKVKGSHEFFADRKPRNKIRLNFLRNSPDRNAEGIRRIAEVIKAHS